MLLDTETKTAQTLVSELSALSLIYLLKIKRHKPSRIDQIPAQLIKAAGRTIRYETHKLIISVWNKKKLPEEWKQSINVLSIKVR